MRFYEFESKRVLAKHGIPIPEGETVPSAAEAEAAASRLGGRVALKAQVLSPAALRASLREAEGGAEARRHAEDLLGLEDGGRKPLGLLVERRPEGVGELSLSFSYDGIAKRPVMAAADRAGRVADIEESEPAAIRRRHFSALLPFSDYLAKELVASLGLSGRELTRLAAIVARLARLFLRYDLTQLDVTSLRKLSDGSFVVLDCFMDLEVEGRPRQKALLDELGIREDDTRAVREPTPFEVEGKRIDDEDPRGIVGPVVEFDGNLGLVIGAGGGSLTLTDAVRKHGGRPANYAAIGGNPSVQKAARLVKLVLSKPGVEKVAVMSNVVSNTRADLVARGVIKGVIELGFDPAEKIVMFRVPGAWETDAFQILEKYGVEYCDRSVSLSEAARRAVEKVQG